MKRSWTTTLLTAGLVILLGALGVLQYQWMKRINESDGEKARQRVREQTERFAMDFNREIQGTYFNFQTDAEPWKKKDWSAFNERYDFWKANSAYPNLITDVYFFEKGGNAAPMKYDRQGRVFQQVEETPELSAIRSRFADEKNFKPVDAASFTLLLPIHDTALRDKIERVVLRTPNPDTIAEHVEMPPRYGYLAIKLDEATIKEGILNDLKAKYFGDGEFNVAVTDTSGQPIYRSLASGNTDATARLFDLAPNNFVFYANKDLMNTLGGQRHEGPPIVDSHIETRSFNRIETRDDRSGAVKVEIKGDAAPRTKIFTATTENGRLESPWTLSVQHTSGSLDGYIASTLSRNLSIGFGILFLLAAAIAAIIISSMRARALAQRQLDFVSSVSHEFRTPLAVIYSAGENLADGVAKENAQVSRYGNLIKGEGRKLTAMVEQILDFAGANSGRRKFSFTATAVEEVVGSAIDECRSLIDESHVKVETSVGENLPIIRADKSALSQAIQNLIANSIKYTNGDAWLRVSAVNGGGKVKVTVEDRGIGISKSDLRQIFEPFYRSKHVVDAQIHGNGLGLSLVKQIVTAHGGKVTAQSELHKGSTFTIELPV